MFFFILVYTNGRVYIKRKIIAYKIEHVANMSHVALNPYLSFKAPPRIGAIRQPIAYEVLNTPELKSITYSLRYSLSSRIFSFSLTTSMISASKGTKMKESETPARALPTNIRAIDYGKPSI